MLIVGMGLDSSASGQNLGGEPLAFRYASEDDEALGHEAARNEHHVHGGTAED